MSMTENSEASPSTSQQGGNAENTMDRHREKDTDLAHRWRTIGAAQRYGDGIRIAIIFGPLEGHYAIDAQGARRLLVDKCPEVPLWQIGAGRMPGVCGSAQWSRNKRMILLSAPGAGSRAGVPQMSGAHIAAHWLRGEKSAIAVVAPPEPRPAAGGIPA